MSVFSIRAALTCCCRPLGSVALHTQTGEIRHQTVSQSSRHTSAPGILSAQSRDRVTCTHTPTYRRRVTQLVAADLEVGLGRVFILHLFKGEKQSVNADRKQLNTYRFDSHFMEEMQDFQAVVQLFTQTQLYMLKSEGVNAAGRSPVGLRHTASALGASLWPS